MVEAPEVVGKVVGAVAKDSGAGADDVDSEPSEVTKPPGLAESLGSDSNSDSESEAEIPIPRC
jgi:hypothetical protein